MPTGKRSNVPCLTVADEKAKDDSYPLVVTVKSSGFTGDNFAEISIGSTPVKLKRNENGHDRGLHVVVINPFRYKIVSAIIFDTYKSSARFHSFLLSPHNKAGYIIIAACKDDCSKELSEKAK